MILALSPSCSFLGWRAGNNVHDALRTPRFLEVFFVGVAVVSSRVQRVQELHLIVAVAHCEPIPVDHQHADNLIRHESLCFVTDDDNFRRQSLLGLDTDVTK